MRRVLILVCLLIVPAALYGQHDPTPPTHDSTGATAAHAAETEARKVAHPEGPPAGGGHGEKKYFGMPGWVLKLLNMALFVGALVYFVGGPVKRAFAERSAAIRAASEEARARRAKSDQMAADIQARLTQIEQEVISIRERAEAEGERQKKELIAAAEAEAAKILQAARNEVDARLKSARHELTEYAGQLAAERAEGILREKITETDQKKIFAESLREVSGA